MPNIVGIRFKEAGKVYYFDPAGIDLVQNDWAVVETAQGRECGLVTLSPREVPDDQIVAPLKKVLRKATPDDMKIVEEREGRERHALEVCEEKVRAHKLDMKLVDVEYAFDGNKILFYFTADGRVDFRALVRDLAAVFRTRIELRQIGVRDEVKMLGGLGPCGREACCRTFLKDFSPVSIRMAKDQSLSLNPTKISGLCGRLMCCLNYEQENYQTTLQRCPKKGVTVLTPEGPAIVEDVLILKEKAKVKLIGDEVEIREYPFADVQEAGPREIAEWEANGGRARAALAKAAYKQAQSKPKPALEEFPEMSRYRIYEEPEAPAEADAEQPAAAKAEPPAGPDAGEEDAEPDDSFEGDDEFDEDEGEAGFDAPDTDKPDIDSPGDRPRREPFPRERTGAPAPAQAQRPPQHAQQNQARSPERSPLQNQPQNPQQGRPPAPGQEVRRRRRRGGRRRGGFHGGPKT
jgi:cell fate regulator YaaT (PSP1 superfamily)